MSAPYSNLLAKLPGRDGTFFGTYILLSTGIIEGLLVFIIFTAIVLVGVNWLNKLDVISYVPEKKGQ